MPKDAPLAGLDVIRPERLREITLACSRQMLNENGLSGRLGYDYEKLNIVAAYNLINTQKLMVEEGIGGAIRFGHLDDILYDSNLFFLPLEPRLEAGMSLVWKKNQAFSKASEAFLERVRSSLSATN
jgi:DNA-binding transcriptional LysR family regulator